MVEQTGHPPIEEEHKSHGRRLHGFRLWLARGVYALLFLTVLIYFIIGFPAFLNYFALGGIGAAVSQTSAGKVILSVQPTGDADNIGVQTGDTLIAVNGTPVISAAQAGKLITGQIGDPVTITVQTGNGVPRQYVLAYAGGILNLIIQLHLSLQFLSIYYAVFTCLLALGVILTSPMVFFRRSNDWLVILVAFSMIAFASFFMAPVGFGAYKVNMGFMNNLIYIIGMASMLIVFFIFPSGHFEPRWTRWLAIFIFIPAFLDFLNLELIYSVWLDFFLWVGLFAVGAFAQIYRYQRVATPSERQQTKQVVLGVVACISLIVIIDLIILFLSYILPNAPFELSSLLLKPWSTLPILVLDLSFVFAIYRYRLWDTDLYINRTVVYGLMTLFLMLIWILTTQALNYASQEFLGKQINWLGALVSSLPVAVIYKPVQKWVEKWVNSRFYKDRIDYSEALIELRPEMWNFLTPSDLGHTLVTIIPALLQSASGALFIQEKKALKLTEVHSMHPSDANKFQFTEEIMKKLESASIVNLPEPAPFAMLVPLTVSRFKVNDLVGVLAIGPRTQGRGYSRDHQNDLSALGRNAGMAMHILKLNEKKHAKEIPAEAKG
jgi:hypothetical protein